MSDYFKRLVDRLTYLVYTKMYGIQETPFLTAEVFLSEKDNKWNSMALIEKGNVNKFSDMTFLYGEEARLSNRNNQWNKLAISVHSSDCPNCTNNSECICD